MLYELRIHTALPGTPPALQARHPGTTSGASAAPANASPPG